MSVEKDIIFSETDKKKSLEKDKEKSEKQEKKQKEFLKTKEKISLYNESSKELNYLKELVNKWIITQEIADKIIFQEVLSKEEIETIFQKIDEIEDIKKIESYIPKELRLNKQEYLQAIEDDIIRVKTITKINRALTLLSQSIVWPWNMWISLFSWVWIILDKNLVIIQENNIDFKKSLNTIHQNKFWKNKNQTFIQKIINFIKEVFN